MGDIQTIDTKLGNIKDLMASIKQLADGQLPDTAGDLYTAPADTQVFVSTIVLVNTHTSSINVNLFLLPAGGNARRLIPPDMPLPSKYTLVYDDGITLDAGDKIRGSASVADKIDYTISGVTQS